MSGDSGNRALLSVSDKAGLIPLARALAARGFELVSTGGTARSLRAAGIAVEEVGILTGYGEFLDGRVKTLHPAIHAAILARRDDGDHQAELAARDIAPFDLVVVNLYPFREAVAAGAPADSIVEQIDIGGPAMIRAAAKNFSSLAVLTDPTDYDPYLAAMAADGVAPVEVRRALAAKAFAHTAAYDRAIATWFEGGAAGELPDRLEITAQRVQLCRYGENPHQAAAVYRLEGERPGIVGARQLQGKELSFNNLADVDAAWRLIGDIATPAVAIIKHGNPCGVATADDIEAAWHRALACDPVSAFGGIVAVNRPLDTSFAELLAGHFAEVVIAPEVTGRARERLQERTALRVLEARFGSPGGLALRSVAGGLLVQTQDLALPDAASWQVVTERAPTPAEAVDLAFAQPIAKHVKSNAIVLARDGATVGIGAGQMSRVDSVRIAVRKAGEGPGSRPCVCASDAFFPFADGLEAAAGAGAAAVIQPGGSRRDDEVIAAANRLGVAMVMTGKRHFRH